MVFIIWLTNRYLNFISNFNKNVGNTIEKAPQFLRDSSQCYGCDSFLLLEHSNKNLSYQKCSYRDIAIPLNPNSSKALLQKQHSGSYLPDGIQNSLKSYRCTGKNRSGNVEQADQICLRIFKVCHWVWWHIVCWRKQLCNFPIDKIIEGSHL